ncbi:hypothetical protein [Megasphaera vaginalis (ex Bordigoni et al. 2020)]|uniref:hypothetical protein n=1 Tax=Megasphaera vaginalis (ex Bordigoni et al. 2020) TaxID=2045301 RepID=UPI000C7AB373|nr:hypothetical protein [Megasphaera vaginalis (ex Bordigoni et al. 2020)]
MERMLRFLRLIEWRQLVYVVRRIAAALLPCRPYEPCGYTTRCPCPAAQTAAVSSTVQVSLCSGCPYGGDGTDGRKERPC